MIAVTPTVTSFLDTPVAGTVRVPDPAWTMEAGDGPVVTAALHGGHQLRDEVAKHLALAEATRRREEDAFCERFAAVSSNRLLVHRSRFEVDLDRPREHAVYQFFGQSLGQSGGQSLGQSGGQTAEEARGQAVWKAGTLPEDLRARSLQLHDRFYHAAKAFLSGLEQQYGRFVVVDLHTRNVRRDGPVAAPDADALSPAITLGTGSLDRARWAPIVAGFLDTLRSADFLGRHLDVHENRSEPGGHFAAWVHRTFPASGCVLVVELKKFFMDEWTGRPDVGQLFALQRVLGIAVTRLTDALRAM